MRRRWPLKAADDEILHHLSSSTKGEDSDRVLKFVKREGTRVIGQSIGRVGREGKYVGFGK